MNLAALLRRAPHGIVLAGSLLVGCKKATGTPAASAAVPTVLGARTAIAAAQPFTETVSAIGMVVGRAGRVAAPSVTVQGRIAEVLVTTGQRVSVGQPLIRLDRSVFAATLQSASAAVTNAEANHERTSRLVAEGISPRKDADQATADLARARADLVAAQRQEELATVRAPIAGVITRMNAAVGSTADPAQPLLEIADPSALDVLLSATPNDAGRIRPGAKVEVNAGQGAHGEALGTGSVLDVGAAIDSTTRSVVVRVRMSTARRPLRIGETVFGQIAVETRPSAVVIPAEALVPEGDGFKVFIVDGQGVAHARAVTLGAQADSLVEITSGLEPGERVVTYGAFGVQDSARVMPP